MKKVAVVLFNLGGPDSLQAVKPFLFNLFNDSAIIAAPTPIRWLLAKWISSRRTATAQEIYNHIGGRSPLLPQTEAQANALEAQLMASRQAEFRCFIAMRYWHPFVEEAAEKVAAFAPDEIILLPLYPQFSTTTTGSAFTAWQKAADRHGLAAITARRVCCYPQAEGWISANAKLITDAVESANINDFRILFSAHGLPKKIVDGGDPYQSQIERTSSALVAALTPQLQEYNWDWQICYQSRVGPLEWIGPSTELEIERAGLEQRALIIVPVAFVSEHSETLVELDIEYRALAEKAGVPHFSRVPTVGVETSFVHCLAEIITNSRQWPNGLCTSDQRRRLCDNAFTKCICSPEMSISG